MFRIGVCGDDLATASLLLEQGQADLLTLSDGGPLLARCARGHVRVLAETSSARAPRRAERLTRVARVPDRCGARPVAEALYQGAGLVVLADPPALMAPLVAGIWHFGWNPVDVIELAGAAVAALALHAARGPRLLELFRDGRAVLTKPQGAAGQVTVADVTRDLRPAFASGRHHCADVIVPDGTVRLSQESADRVRFEPGPGIPAAAATTPLPIVWES